jgi:hypothetical protein
MSRMAKINFTGRVANINTAMPYHSGQLVPFSGIYWSSYPSCVHNTGYQVRVDRGDRFPPTPAIGYSFILLQPIYRR